MKPKIKKPKYKLVILFSISCFLLFLQSTLKAQDSTADNTIAQTKQREKPVKNTFRSVWIIDDQTVMVPVKGTFEIDIMHRFGTVQNGIKDMWGLFSTANIRLGASYVPINNLYLGLGLTKTKMLLDGSAKYAIIKQTKHMSPVSITYFGDMAYDTREDPNHILFKYGTERLSYFNELIFARKVSDKLSVQFAVGISHQNSVPGYYTQYDSTAKVIFNEEKFDLFSLAVSARYKITDVTSVI
ncbi:MAG: hypothetical protein KGM98_05565, partial [Bacteroidota bacterium]|nr:hypothetical protein [Bacteroidota bacterium]